MKTLLMTFLLVAATIPAFAKMTVFNTTDAIKLVINDATTMQKILGANLRQSEMTSVMASSSGDGLRKNFTVQIVTSSKGGVNAGPCMTDVSLSTVTRLAGSPGGGPGISSNKLVISNVAPANCAP